MRLVSLFVAKDIFKIFILKSTLNEIFPTGTVCKNYKFDRFQTHCDYRHFPRYEFIQKCRFLYVQPKEDSISVEYRAVSLVFQNIDPPPTPSPPAECVLPPQQRREGTHARRGGWESIFWKTPDIGLASYSNNLSTVQPLCGGDRNHHHHNRGGH